MGIKKYLDYRLFGLLGSILMIVSEFLAWFSDLTLLQIYQLKSALYSADAFLYLFPVISGVICIIASLLTLYSEEYRINAIIIYLVGLGFMLLFIYDFVTDELNFLNYAGIGLYFCIAGFLFVLIDIINILISND
jgi:hypothetical protein